MFALFDPIYWVILAPGMLLAIWAQVKVKSAIAHASRIRPSSGLSGAEAAARILRAQGLDHVQIEPTRGFLGDHYDPRKETLRLTPAIYQGRTLAAVGIAAHEAGHALQHAAAYAPLAVRNLLVPTASIGSNLSFALIFGGVIFSWPGLIMLGIVLFSAVVLFQVVNLPVEFNASSRAREVLVENGIVARSELVPISRVLNAAAMTYVAATITAILTLIYFLLRSGVLGSRH